VNRDVMQAKLPDKLSHP